MNHLIRKTKSLNFLQVKNTPTQPPPLVTMPHPEAVKLLHEIDMILEEIDSMPRVYRHKNPTFLQTFLKTIDEKTTQFLNDRYTS